MKTKFTEPSRSQTFQRLGQVVGCKWSVSILQAIRQGARRPDAMQRQIAGISEKILDERLTQLTEYGLLKKDSLPEVPPRTEYRPTTLGRRLTDIIDQIQDLNRDLALPDGKHRRPAFFVPTGHP